MSWRKITCAERDAIFHAERSEKLAPIASCTDMSGEFHGGGPQMDITWGLASTDTPVLRETRYPSQEDGQPDRKPCEHYVFEPEPPAEVLVCPDEDYSSCDLIGPYRGPAPIHYCEYDEGHDDAHECACGYRWTNQEED